MDRMVKAIWRKDTALTVCCDAPGVKWFVFGRWGLASVSKSEFPGLINHHYSAMFVVVVSNLFAFWINRSRSPLLKGNYGVFWIIIRDMFSYTGLAQVDMTKVTVALHYSDSTKVTPGYVLGTVIGIHYFCWVWK